MRTEDLILQSLLHNESFTRRVVAYVNREYFHDKSDQVVFDSISTYFTKYNQLPSKEAMLIEVGNCKLPQETIQQIEEKLKTYQPIQESLDYLVETAENFCKRQAVYNALMDSIQIADGKDKKRTPEAIPSILQEALAVCFDTAIGHDFTDDSDARYEYYHKKENKITTGQVLWDKVMDGGPMRKTLNVLLAPPHGGKTLMMVNFAIGAMKAGFNVLYLTMEMAEEEIARRFDVNMLNVDFPTLKTLPKGVFNSKFEKLKEKALGKLKIKQYPTGGGHAGHFKNLIQELKTKQDFVPDVIVVDYLNICASERYRAGSTANSYTIVKSIGEELRALAIETDTAIWTATQTTRGGIGNSDVDMTNTSESIGIPAIADSFFAIITSDELISAKQRLIKQLKNRFRDLNMDNKFLVGVDTSKMKMYDLEDDAQDTVIGSNRTTDKIQKAIEDRPLFDSPKAKTGFNFDGFDYE